MREELRRSAAHVLVDDLERPELRDDDQHHLTRVLRLRAGEAVTVTDGEGGWRTCSFGDRTRLDPTGEVVREARPEPSLGVGFAPAKGDRPELVVQKLTELGIDRIVVVGTARAVVRWDDDRAGKALSRLRRITVEAAMQSRRVWLPEVTGPVPVLEVVRSADVALAEPGGDPPSLARPVVVIGPEGGWTPNELEGAAATVDLGPQILRAETAAIAAGVLLASLRQRMRPD